MKKGDFIWADLSTYDITSSVEFYKNVFGWEVADDNGYFLAKSGITNLAGIFKTPAFLKKIKMPHFWMSYFQVDSTAEAVRLAKSMGGIVEVDARDFNNGKIALIRDPQGAGFTVYDGKELFLETSSTDNIARTELHVSDLENVLPFYRALFGWQMTEVGHSTYAVHTEYGGCRVVLREIDNTIKGKYEYWAVTILVTDLQATTKRVLEHKGHLVAKEMSRNLMTDNSCEAFFYLEERQN